MPLSAGDRLGPYEILAHIGAGGMGDVYKARDTRLDRMVAIKVSKEQFSERFEREARAVAALNHPNICTLYDVGPNYLVMELVEGAPLKGPVPWEKAAGYAGQILDALEVAHRKGITHRDLKPANILITKQGAKLLDFGLAKQAAGLNEADATLTNALTGQGQILGTLHYMAPEQLQGRNADARSDIFAFGLVLYEMVAGKRAFDSDSAASLIGAILHTEPAPIPAAQPAAPPALDRVVRKCLAKNPDDRFQAAREVRVALEWSTSAPAVPAAAPQGRSKPWPWIVAALAVALASTVAAVHFLAGPPPAALTAFTVFPENKTALSGFVAVSPSGRQIAFVARDSAGISQLWLRSLDSTETRPVAGTEGATSVGWSPDGHSVAFLTANKLKSVEVASSQVFSIADISGAPRGLYWAPDRTIVFATGGAPIRRAPVTGGVPQDVTTLDRSRGEVEHCHPWLLPGGKRFLFLVRSAQPETRGIWVASLAKPSDRKRVLDDNSAAAFADGYLLFVRGGVLMAQPFDPDRAEPGGTATVVAPKIGYSPTSGFGAFGVSGGGVLAWSPVYTVTSKARLTWFARSGARIEDVGPARNYVSVALSPDGKRIATSDLDLSMAWPILIVDPARGSVTEIGRQDAAHQYPVWSPDASQIAYENVRGGGVGFSVQDLSGAGGERSILENASGGRPNDWSRDGRLLLYTGASGNGRSSLWTIASDGSGKAERLLPADFNSRDGQFSPDGHWVAYSAVESAVEQVYIQSFPLGRGKWQISSDGGSQPRWRRDGKELFYVDPLGKMMSVEIKPGAVLEPGASKALFAFRGSNNPFSTFRYDVTADGGKFLILTPVEDLSFDPLHVAINWTAPLKK